MLFKLEWFTSDNLHSFEGMKQLNLMESGFAGSERRRLARAGPGAEPPRSDLIALVLGMYREMPGLSLDVSQAGRLFGLRETTCRILLDDFVRLGYLRRLQDGQYALA
jgi:hypothetical protein